MSNRSLITALMAASAMALTALPTSAAAQSIDNIVSFGDSYADTGNAVALILGNPLTPAATRQQLLQTYPTGRFSGGTNYIDTLSQIRGVPVENYAIGGALTGTGNVNFGLPGFTQETQIFLSGTRPAGNTSFPISDRVFGPNDLLAVSVGGNDARFYQQNGGTLAGAPAAAAVAVTNATNNLNLLVGAGARNISFLAGNTAILPEVATNPTAQAVRNAYSTTFNNGIRSTLAGYAANGAIVNYLDLSLVRQRIAADPAAFGLASAGACPLAAAQQCVTDANFANQFLFYVDALHLTSAGFAIVARYADVQLDAPLGLQATSDLGLDTARQFGRTLNSRMDTGSPRDGEVAEGLRLFVVGDTFSRDVGRTDRNEKFDIDGVGVTGGVEFGFGNGVIGLAGNYSRPRVKFANDSTRVRSRALQVGGYAGYAIGPAFVQAHAGYGDDRHKIVRTGVIDNLRARPDGNHWLAGAKAGFLMGLGAFRVGPVVALDYARAEVDGYSEDGDAALALNVDDISAKALTGNVGIEARGDYDGGGISLRPFLSAMLEKDLSGDSRSAVYALTSAPEIVNTFRFEDRSKDLHGRISGGVGAAILPGASLDVSGSTTLGRDQGEEVSAHLGFRMGF